jgi:hypothetical protein
MAVRVRQRAAAGGGPLPVAKHLAGRQRRAAGLCPSPPVVALKVRLGSGGVPQPRTRTQARRRRTWWTRTVLRRPAGARARPGPPGPGPEALVHLPRASGPPTLSRPGPARLVVVTVTVTVVPSQPLNMNRAPGRARPGPVTVQCSEPASATESGGSVDRAADRVYPPQVY